MPKIQWQPLSMLPTITTMAEEALTDSQNQLANFITAQARPYSLDTATVLHAERVYTEQGEYLHIYAEQCKRWQQSTSSPRQQRDLAHLADVVTQAIAINTQILALLPELKDHTIERLMEKSDLELGLEELQRQRTKG